MSAPNGTANGHAPPPAQSMRVNHIVHSDMTDPRDSAYFSSSSKHTSAASFAQQQLQSPPGSGAHSSPADPEKTPSPTTPSQHAPPIVSQTDNGMLTSAPGPSNGPSAATDPRLYHPPSQPEIGVNGTALSYADADSLSRRTSVDSRMNQGFNDLNMGSPYLMHNQSTGSIQSTLATQRHPRPALDHALDHASTHRISNGYQPSADRNPDTLSNRASRVAPVIKGPTASTVARAAEPTKGQAWAFPEDDRPGVPGVMYREDPREDRDQSRRSSVADSYASSQYTAESRLPAGQRRLDDAGDYSGVMNAHHEYQPAPHEYPPAPLETRMSHDDDDDGSPEGAAGSQPYSRTPESRQSHKMAERKRRTEMKELFESLRDLMPQDRGAKASKWEILQKAIAEHRRQTEVYRQLQGQFNGVLQEMEAMRAENHSLKTENHHMRMQIGHRSSYTAAPPPTPGPQPGQYPADPYAGSRTELPPLRSIGSLPQGPEGMTGVQYEGSRPPSFRSERPQ